MDLPTIKLQRNAKNAQQNLQLKEMENATNAPNKLTTMKKQKFVFNVVMEVNMMKKQKNVLQYNSSFVPKMQNITQKHCCVSVQQINLSMMEKSVSDAMPLNT